ncbi:hypothetical protein DFH07DRAFT_931621 [Mycena maculata]|uniref:Protein kinase domain-containing protein n=1 Tax=Mycena maculata TaxID=230809 RepID=A0AAD7HP08_9AGAR|nr:hypothetical protein DFH07DRAFT_931621 [Mycena maculata]
MCTYLIPYFQQIRLLDATRISDNAPVMLKLCNLIDYPEEVSILEFLLSGERATDPRNHCIPIYEILRIPDSDLTDIGMLFLYDLVSPKFDTVGEAVECFRQLLEAHQCPAYLMGLLYFSHPLNRDCKCDSFMVESTPLPHPLKPETRRDFGGPPRALKTRTQNPVKYFSIDYNLLSRYNDVGRHLELGGWGGDKTVPEFRTEELCDPFPVDVYCLGNTIRRYFTKGYEDGMNPGKKGFGFMKDLFQDMCRDDPKTRPTMNVTVTEVISRVQIIQLGLSELKLRSRVPAKDEFIVLGLFRSLNHWVRQIVPI